MLSTNPSTGQCDTLQVNALSLPMIWCPPGRCVIGTPDTYSDFFITHWSREVPGNEMPTHTMILPHGFWIGRTVITQEIWQQTIQGYRPFFKKGENMPALCFRWTNAVIFCQTLERMLSMSGQLPAGFQVSLPSSSQWEYACRAGTKTLWFFGDDVNLLDQYGWYKNNAPRVQPVEQKRANPWGIQDLYGNVEEWCLDHDRRYTSDLKIEPVNDFAASNSKFRTVRGGYYNQPDQNCRSAYTSILDIYNDEPFEIGVRIIITQGSSGVSP